MPTDIGAILDTVQNEEETCRFLDDFFKVRLELLSTNFAAVHSSVERDGPDLPELDWSELKALRKAGIRAEWLEEPDFAEKYMHPAYLNAENWNHIVYFMERACVSDKQRTALFPILAGANRPDSLDSEDGMTAALTEVSRLNRFVNWVDSYNLDYKEHRLYQESLGIHGRWQNTSGIIGLGGAVVAIFDALSELGIGVADTEPSGFANGFANGTPVDFYRRYVQHGPQWHPKSVLLDNGRAIIFKANPDVAIVKPLNEPFASAKDASKKWSKVNKNLNERRNIFHEFANIEVKTALDRQNLRERVALALRERQDQVRTERYLTMAIIISDIVEQIEGQLGSHFSGLFNLYFLWGYDDARRDHLDHWHRFKECIKAWCG